MSLHHDVLQANYVQRTNEALERLARLRSQGGSAEDVRRRRFGAVMSLVSNASGAFLHQLYWENLSPQPTAMSAELSSALAGTFGSVESFLDEFADIALTIPGSGWAVLAYSPYLGQLVVMPVSKHDQHLIPGAMPLLVCDVWEHAYYLDHPADRAGYLRGFFEHVDWAVVARRLREALV